MAKIQYAHGRLGYEETVELIVDAAVDLRDPSGVIVIGNKGDREQLIEDLERAGYDPATGRVAYMPDKPAADGLGDVEASLASEEDAEKLIGSIQSGKFEDDPEDAPRRRIRLLVDLYQDVNEKYLPLVMQKCPKLTVVSVRMLDPDDPHKEGIFEHEDKRSRPQWVMGNTIKPKVLDWHWKGRIPRAMVGAFVGEPSLGKSTMLYDFMARASIGADWLDGQENEGGVIESIVLTCEDDKESIVIPRLKVAGADLSKIHFLESIQYFGEDDELKDERMATLEADLAVIEQRVIEHPAIKFVMVDPWSNYLGKADLFKEQEVRKVLARVVKSASDHDVAYGLVMHNSKQTGRNALQKAIGAIGNVGTGRIAWSFQVDDKNPEHKQMLLMKENLGKFDGIVFTTVTEMLKIDGKDTPQARIQYIGPTNRKADDAVAQNDDPERKRLNRAEQIVLKHMPKDRKDATWVVSEPISEELRKKCGYSRNQAQTLRDELGIKVQNIKGVWHWQWKSTTSEPSPQLGLQDEEVPF